MKFGKGGANSTEADGAGSRAFEAFASEDVVGVLPELSALGNKAAIVNLVVEFAVMMEGRCPVMNKLGDP